MPSVQTIRKQLLQALDGHLLPAFEASQYPSQVLIEFPLHLPPEIGVTHLPIPPLENKPLGVQQNWRAERLNSSPNAIIIIVFEGPADIRIGTTERMAKAMAGQDEWAQSGCHVLHFGSPACLLIPADTPFSDGSVPHWENPDVPPPTTKLFWIDQMSKWVLCHICSTQGGVHKSEHSLKVQDEDVIALISLLTGELRRRAAGSKTIINNYLGALLHCLQRRLTHEIPVIANTVHLPPPEVASAEQPTAADRIIAIADEFVHSCLGEPITLPEMAKYCGVSPTHLNRVFQARLGISAKRFIYQQRIRSAQRILTESDMPIKEVASLVGFSHASHFCRVFQRDVKLSPTEFRTRHRS